MKSAPFNLCDYRCERCLETDECAVFRILRDRSLLPRNSGENRLDAILNDLRESFRETEAMIKQKALELGINIGGLAGADVEIEIRDEVPDDLLYRECRTFVTDTKHFMLKLNKKALEQDGEYVNDLAWHHSVITPKIHRALRWKTDGGIASDAKNSAAVAVKSITICIMALDHMSRHPEIAGECSRLSSYGSRLKARIRKRFKTNAISKS